MQPLNIKLYDLARAKLHLKDSDAMEFVSKELSETKFKILKWLFIFWVGQLSITIGIVLMLIKK